MAKRRSKPLVFDGESSCFSDARWSNGVCYLTFARDNAQDTIPMSRKEAKEFFDSGSLGETYNEEYR